MTNKPFRTVVALLCATFSATVSLSASAESRISIVIDDLGHHLKRGQQVIDLPGPVACAVLPHTPHREQLMSSAHAAGKEILVHLPLEPQDPSKANDPGLLTTSMAQDEFMQQLAINLDQIPNAIGVSNHKGSLLTQDNERMDWIMDTLRERQIRYFVDSRTIAKSVAMAQALENGLATTRRNVFLDNERDEAYINRQFDKLIEKSRRNGTALAIGHPYPETIAVLKKRIPELESQGITLVSLTALVDEQQRTAASEQSWQLSSSR